MFDKEIKEVIKEYLKENLTVEVILDCDEDIDVSLYLEGEKFSEDYASTGCIFQKIN